MPDGGREIGGREGDRGGGDTGERPGARAARDPNPTPEGGDRGPRFEPNIEIKSDAPKRPGGFFGFDYEDLKSIEPRLRAAPTDMTLSIEIRRKFGVSTAIGDANVHVGFQLSSSLLHSGITVGGRLCVGFVADTNAAWGAGSASQKARNALASVGGIEGGISAGQPRETVVRSGDTTRVRTGNLTTDQDGRVTGVSTDGGVGAESCLVDVDMLISPVIVIDAVDGAIKATADSGQLGFMNARDLRSLTGIWGP